MKPFNPEEIKTFRAPKYGGVTLSLLSMFVLASMIVVWNKIGEQGQEQFNQSIRVRCDESIAIPVKECAEQFEREMKIKVSIHPTAGLDQNGSKAKGTVNGDAYDLDLFTGKANGQDLSLNQVPCAFRSIVFATRTIFPRDDRARRGFSKQPGLFQFPRLSQRRKAFGTLPWKDKLVAESSFQKSENLSLFQRACFGSGFGKNLDGAFMWDFSARNFDLKIHRIRELESASQTLFARTSDSAQNRLSALQFARFLAAPTRGQFYFAKAGFVGVNGDAWAEKPFLYVYCAKPVEGFILDEFERFESEALVSIERHFLKEEKMALSLSLIAQSKAKKALPDLVFGLPQNQNAQMPTQYQKSSETLLINGAKISVHVLRTTRFRSPRENSLTFFCTKKRRTRFTWTSEILSDCHKSGLRFCGRRISLDGCDLPSKYSWWHPFFPIFSCQKMKPPNGPGIESFRKIQMTFLKSKPGCNLCFPRFKEP